MFKEQNKIYSVSPIIESHKIQRIENVVKPQRSSSVSSLHGIENNVYKHKHSTFIIVPSSTKLKNNKRVTSPTICFPHPPKESSISSVSSNTSSVYYIKKQKGDKNQDERKYATIKKQGNKYKQSKYKRNKRKHFNTDYTGEMHMPETSQNIGPFLSDKYDYEREGDLDSESDDTFGTSDGKNSHFYEHIDALNSVVIGNREQIENSGNKGKSLVHRKEQERIEGYTKKKFNSSNFSDKNKLYKSTVNQTSTSNTFNEDAKHFAYSNKNNEPNIDATEKSMKFYKNSQKDDLSVGSFLSMESINSFPKYELPEPLARVLEPLSITYFDHFNETEAIAAATITARKPRIVDTKVKTSNGPIMSTRTYDGKFLRSYSDATDPGVIGPAVWKMHKQQLEKEGLLCQNILYDMLRNGIRHKFKIS